jgi:hypothetical protein
VHWGCYNNNPTAGTNREIHPVNEQTSGKVRASHVEVYRFCSVLHCQAREVAMTLRPFTLCVVFLVAIPLAVSCGSGKNGSRQMLSLAVHPVVANPTAGANVQFTAIGAFNKAPSPAAVAPMMWQETAVDGLHGGTGIATVDQSGLAHCNGSGTSWVTATALSGALNDYDPALVRGTAQLNCP